MALDIRATLRVISTKHTLAELRCTIGDPKHGFSIGDEFSKGKKNREHTYWSFDSSGISERRSFDKHLSEVLDFYELRKIEMITLRQEGCVVNVMCLFSSDNGQGGAELSSKTIDRLSKLNLDLVFDIYAE